MSDEKALQRLTAYMVDVHRLHDTLSELFSSSIKPSLPLATMAQLDGPALAPQGMSKACCKPKS